MTNYYHIFLYMFCQLFILFLFFMHLGIVTRGISLCRQHNDNKVLELERLPKSIHARTSTSASRTSISDSVKFFFSLCSSFSSIEIWILACALLYDNDIN